MPTKAWRVANPEKVRARQERLDVIKEELGCLRCGIKDSRVLDFHHRDATEKSFGIARRRDSSMEKLKTEIEKCDVLCSNCHRITEYEKRKNGR